MISSLILTLPIFGGFALASPAAQIFERAVCNKDNCLNVMTNTLSLATPFCSTFLQSTSTTYVTPVVTISGTNTIFPSSTSYATIPAQVTPAHIATQCNLATPTVSATLISGSARYSSACNCLPTPVVPATVTTTLVASTTTTTIPVPTGSPFTLQVTGTSTFYDGEYLVFNDCSGGTGNPFLFVEGGSTQLVFGTDGYLHVASCFNVVAGVFSGSTPDVFFLLDPTHPGTDGFVPSPCTNADGDLSCTGLNGETVFYFPDESWGVESELYFGDANYGTPVTPEIILS